MVRLGLKRAELADYSKDCGLGRGRHKQGGLLWASSLESLSPCVAGSDGSKEPRTNQYVLGQLLWWLGCHSGSANNWSPVTGESALTALGKLGQEAAWCGTAGRRRLCAGGQVTEPGPAGWLPSRGFGQVTFTMSTLVPPCLALSSDHSLPFFHPPPLLSFNYYGQVLSEPWAGESKRDPRLSFSCVWYHTHRTQSQEQSL